MIPDKFEIWFSVDVELRESSLRKGWSYGLLTFDNGSKEYFRRPPDGAWEKIESLEPEAYDFELIVRSKTH